jgi:hypothetical protein
VVQTIPPAPSADELRDAQAAKLQSDADAHLLRLYTSVEDVDRAKNRRLAELDGLIVVAQGNIQNLVAQQGALQTQAADQERAGRPVPKTLLDQMDDLRDQQQNLKVDICVTRSLELRLRPSLRRIARGCEASRSVRQLFRRYSERSTWTVQASSPALPQPVIAVHYRVKPTLRADMDRRQILPSIIPDLIASKRS